MSRRPFPVMTLVRERRLAGLIKPPAGSTVLEASGVIAKGRDYYVIFDNIRRIARIDPSLAEGAARHGWFGSKREGDGYEDIAFSPHTRRFYLLVEGEKHTDGTYRGLIDQCDEAGRFKGRHWIDFSFEKRNTGFEGLSVVRRAGRDYLLALCEGNRCRAGRRGKKPGGGRVQVLQQAGRANRSTARWGDCAGCRRAPSCLSPTYARRTSRTAAAGSGISRSMFFEFRPVAAGDFSTQWCRVPISSARSHPFAPTRRRVLRIFERTTAFPAVLFVACSVSSIASTRAERSSSLSRCTPTAGHSALSSG